MIDQFLHTGNTQKRFLAFDVIDGKLLNENFAYIKKDSKYRKATCDFLRESDLIKGSILTSIQYRMISKGISI